ncbi:MAG TPA: methyltransferase domain-containing protein [Anaerolineales bacterium]|nr:methyltransferase domain-containing protein [Anaerolineales bacterium]
MKLQVGCGRDVRIGYLNLDKIRLQGVEIVADLERGLPFAAGCFTEIIAFNILEHVEDLPAVMADLYRILTPDGSLHIKVPHFTHRGAFSDPTHKNFCTYDTFFYFTRDFSWNYYFNFAFTSIHAKIIFPKGKQIYNYLVEPVMNRIPVIYELTFLRSLFPAHQVDVVLKK